MRNKLFDYHIRQLEGTEKPILTQKSYKPLYNKELTAIVRNATNNVNTQLNTIEANFQQYHRQP